MNLFVKKNIVLVSVLAVSGVVGVVLLVFISIISFNLFETFSEIDQVKKNVAELNRKTPAPCSENEDRIRKDIAVVDKAINGFSGKFSIPMQDAVDEFIKVLQPPRVANGKPGSVGLTEEEYEKYRYVYPKEDEMDEEQRQKLPKRAKKLTLAEFKELYSSRFERDYGESASKNMLATQEFFIDRFCRLFPNWKAALHAFVEKAKEVTVEPVAVFNDESILLTAMGFPRAIPLPGAFTRHMEEYTLELKKIAGEDETKFLLAPAALEFMSKTGQTYNPADVREIYFHRDVFGNLLSYVVKSGVKAMHDIKVRDFSETPEEGRLFGNLSESIGNFKVYHYTIEVSGALPDVRNLCKMLDEAYLSKRLYIVRAVTLYAEENGAAVLMGQKEPPKEENKKENEVEIQGRRRRRRQVEEVSASDKENWEKMQEELEMQKPPEKRRTYGNVLVGKDPSCRALIDIDYIIPEQQQ